MRGRVCAALTLLALLAAPAALREVADDDRGLATLAGPLSEKGRAGRDPDAPARVASPALKREPALDLPLGRSVARRCESPAVHVYRLRVEAGSYVELSLAAREAGLALRLLPPGGPPLDLDRPGPPHGRDAFGFVTDLGGEARIEITPRASRLDPEAGYTLRAHGRAAGAVERRRARAFELVARAETLLHTDEYAAYARARDLLVRAAGEWRALGDAGEEAFALRRGGLTAMEQGDWPAAAQMLAGAEARSLAGHDRGGAAQALAARALLQFLLQHSGAAALAEQARGRALEAGDARAVARARHVLGQIKAASGSPYPALVDYAAAREVFERWGDDDARADVLYNEGEAFTFLGRTDDARARFTQAYELYGRVRAPRGRGRSLAQLGWLSHLDGDDAAALADHDEAYQTLKATGFAAELPGVLDRRATSLGRLGRNQEALQAYEESLRYYRESGQHQYAARVLANIAQARARLGDMHGARSLFDQSMSTLRQTGDDDVLADLYVASSALRRKAGDLDGAYRDAGQARQILDGLRAAVSDDASRAAYLAARYNCFTTYADVLMDLDQAHPGEGYARRAFEVAKEGRARTLLDALERPGHAALVAARPQAGAADAQDREMLAAASGLRPDVEQHLRTRRLDDEQRARRHAARTQVTTAQPLALGQIQREVLDDDTLLLAYMLGEDRSFVWLVGRDVFETYKLAAGREIEAQAHRLRKSLPEARTASEWGPALLAARKLADLLLPEALCARLGRRRLLIVADGVLQYVPFGVLLVPPTSADAARPLPADWAPGRVPLLLEHELARVPSASVLAALRRREARRPKPTREVAVLADPVFEARDTRLAASWPGRRRPAPVALGQAPPSDLVSGARAAGLASFPRLLHTVDEAARICSLIPAGQSTALVGFDATLEAVRDQKLREFRILHFATHGFVHPRLPELSGLVLSRFDRAGRARPGFLRPDVLAQLHLSAELVVLSACRTAFLGRELRGEGVVGLPQGFMQAGAPRVVVSLWNVDDRATAELMPRFYQALYEHHLAPAAALRAAQIGLLSQREFEAPAYWAAFVLDGDWRPLASRAPNN